MIIISFIITLLYLFLIGSFILGFDKVKPYKLEDIPSNTKFSIIIPFRNEAENLSDLLKSISALKYPNHLYEIIFVNDASEDDSVEIIKRVLDSSAERSRSTKLPNENFTRTDISIIKNERKTNSPKKDAITTAIKQSKYDWIITTDADCVLPNYWLDSFDQCIQKTNAKCIVAPVVYPIETSFLSKFQLLDILSLQGATIGGFGINKPFLCNGANFGYTKELFNELNGFDGNTNIASGDDIFLLEKAIKKHPKDVLYLKSEQATVTTKPQPTIKHLISQRIRWAAKTSAYNNWFGKLAGLIVLLMNALIIASLLLSIIGVFNVKIWFYILFIKFNIDLLLIYKSVVFFNRKDVLKSYLFGFLLYPFFSVYIAFISFFIDYKWKGRRFKK